MAYETLPIAERLRETRIARKLSQLDLSNLSGVPQAQISRIETGTVDLRFSTLVALANALDLQVTLVPRQAMSAVKAVLRVGSESDEPLPAYTLDEDNDDL